MTERLHRIHAMLRAGNVPCGLATLPELGLVLHAGTPENRTQDVLLYDIGSALRLEDARGVVAVPPGMTDAEIADAVKYQVVVAFADNGNQEAIALLQALRPSTAPRPGADESWPYAPPAMGFPILDPFEIVEQFAQLAHHLGRAFLPQAPTSVSFNWWSPWGSYQVSRHRR